MKNEITPEMEQIMNDTENQPPQFSSIEDMLNQSGGLNYLITAGHEMKPFCCPVCCGRGTVSRGFYDGLEVSTTDATPETCRSCQGTGIVWSDAIQSL